MAGALDDVRVVDASGPIGHYAGRLLADLGADVIKLEPPSGDAARAWPPFLPGVEPPENGLDFLLLNANKRGVTLDVSRPEGRDIFLRLLATADVLIDSWQPHQSRALELSDDVLEAARPDLIRASVTGWGLSGPRAEWAYADIVGVATSGAMALAGFPEGPPEQLPDLQGYHCASINAAAGVLAALLHRDASGEGQRVEVSMQESLVIAQETAMQAADILGTDRQRTGDRSALGFRMPGFGLYRCADGYVYMMASGLAGSGFPGLLELMAESGDTGGLDEEPWASFIAESMNRGLLAAAMADPAKLEELQGKLAHIEEVTAAFTRRHPKQYIYEQGQKKRVLVGMVSTPADISQSPQLSARRWFVEIDDPGRGTRLRYPGPPWHMRATPGGVRRPAPLLGEHNFEVFGELGVEAAAVESLASAGVL